ncbi:efflux transporter outer membrane subunit [Coraliomargarita parva]|uniref:efflux transporter outer membrane subunit n=1 Tax=Coraliomargarita parva TaxID=3014050 RepID=UPI0022B55FEC|nr:efflux transporter outer membrane subunit [Coraliomargarita parva]
MPLNQIQSALTLTTAALLAGCASAPQPAAAPDLAIPGSWAARSTDATGAETWGSLFQSEGLAERIEMALLQNPDLALTAARLDQAIAEARIAGADRLPSLGLGLGGSRQKINSFGPQSVGGIRFENYELKLNLSWELDVWGKLRDQKSAALGEVQASDSDLAGARLSLQARVAQAWFNLLEAREQLTLAEKNAAAYQANLDTLESRFQRGLSDGLDLRRIRALSAGAEAEVSSRQQALDQATRSLEILQGAYPDGQTETEACLPALPAALDAGLPASLLERRPDLIAAERRLAASEATLNAARKERLPQISLTASGGTASQEFKDLLDSDFSVWSLGANLAQPVFQGGRIQGGIDRAAAQRKQAAANYRSTALQAFYEVETTLAAETYLKQSYAHIQESADEAEAAEALAWERYRNGTTDFLDALDAQRTSASTRSQAIRQRNQLLQNRIELYLALGGPVDRQP